MTERLTEDDIQCLATIIAMIPTTTTSTETLAKLQALELITERPGGWQATAKGIDTVVNWKSTE